MTKNTDTPRDSSKLQLMSLCVFAHELGISFINGQFYGNAANGTEYVHFNTVVKLHNSTWSYSCKEKGLYTPDFHQHLRGKSPWVIDGRLLRKALASKIVEGVHLQANKNGTIKCQKHWVKFTNEDCYKIFKVMLDDEAKKCLVGVFGNE